MGLLIYIILLLELALCKENAVIFTLCRNSELNGIKNSVLSLEKRFNSKFGYPYVFLNDEEFTDEFKKEMTKVTNNRASFGLVHRDMWAMPKEIDRGRAIKKWKEMKEAGVPYADKESYHNMCRFFSRSFYKHPLVAGYEYYWRVEPNVQFHCDVDEDPFEFMKKNGKKYGFVITIKEFMESIPTLGKQTAEFLKTYSLALRQKMNHNNFMFDDGKYNGCHFWSNFEIASFDFFRSKVYNEYVDHLERTGGFYYERWGDAPVHSIAASLFLNKTEIHFFDNIGYTHDAFTHCPQAGKNCDCDVSKSIDNNPFSCLKKYIVGLK